jgi:hypothetical protein
MHYSKKFMIRGFLILIVSNMSGLLYSMEREWDKGKECIRESFEEYAITIPQEVKPEVQPIIAAQIFKKKYEELPRPKENPYIPFNKDILFFNQLPRKLCEYLFLWCLNEEDVGPYTTEGDRRQWAQGLNYLMRLCQPTDFIVKEMLTVRINNCMKEVKKNEIIQNTNEIIDNEIVDNDDVTQELFVQDILGFMGTVNKALVPQNEFCLQLLDMHTLEHLTSQKLLNREVINEEVARYKDTTKQEVRRLHDNKKKELPVYYEGSCSQPNDDARNYISMRVYFLKHLCKNLRLPLHERYKTRCNVFLLGNTCVPALLGIGGLIGLVITYFDNDEFYDQMRTVSAIGSLGGFLWSALSLCCYKKKCLPEEEIKELETLFTDAAFDIHSLTMGAGERTIYFEDAEEV